MLLPRDFSRCLPFLTGTPYCSIEGGVRLFLGELPSLRRASRLMERRGFFLGSSWAAQQGEGVGAFWGSCAGLLDGGREEALSRDAPCVRLHDLG